MGIIFNNKNISYEILIYLNNNYNNIKILSNNSSFSKIILKCNKNNKKYILKLFLNGRKDETIIFDKIKKRSKYIMYHLKKVEISNNVILTYKYFKKGDLFSFINNSIIYKLLENVIKYFTFINDNIIYYPNYNCFFKL